VGVLKEQLFSLSDYLQTQDEAAEQAKILKSALALLSLYSNDTGR